MLFSFTEGEAELSWLKDAGFHRMVSQYQGKLIIDLQQFIEILVIIIIHPLQDRMI